MARPAPCPDRAALEHLVFGLLTEPEVGALEEHVEHCAGCLRMLRSLGREDGLVRAVQAGARAEPIPPGEMDTELMTRLYRLRPGDRFQGGAGEGLPPTGSAADTPGPGGPTGERLPPLGQPQEPGELGQFGPFPILKVLGAGGMGVVYQARQLRPRRLAALKVSRAGPWADRNRLARFLGEIEVIARLQHPHIVPVYEAGEHGGQPYFLMEFLEGGSLAQQLAAAPLPARAAAALVETLARAVQFAHERGIVHRDLKPANVLLAADGTPKISDFGLAKQLTAEGSEAAPGRATESGLLLGTPAYMAPEQAGGKGAVGPAADVYALGAILYECLTGRPPFKAAGVLETLDQVRSREPVPPGRLQPGVPRDLQTVCLKCLAKEPGHRYGSAGALADDLGRYLAGRPVAARPVRPWVRAGKWARRQPAAAALVGVSGLCLLGLVVGILAHNAELKHALDRAEANEAKALRQREVARDHYRRAREALERVLNQFGDLRPGQVPQLLELRRKQAEEALAFFEGALRDEDDPDPAVRRDVAAACKQAADLRQRLGRQAAAAEMYGRAIRLVEGLPAEERDRPETQLLLAGCYNGRSLGKGPQDFQQVVRDQRRALDILQPLARRRPGDLRVRVALAETEHFLGTSYLAVKRRVEAEPHLRRSVDLLTGLVRDQPDFEAHQARLADNWVDLALLYQGTNRQTEALGAYKKAEDLLQTLLTRHPATGQYTLTLAAMNTNRGLFLKDQGRLPQALARLTRAVDLAEAVVKQEPTYAFARRVARNAHGARAQTCEALGRWADAVRDWDRVVELDDGPRQWLNRALRAEGLARAGDHARAAAEADALAKDPQIPADGLYALACVDALASKAVREDSRLTTAERTALAERYAGAALALLRRLQAQGYFRDAGHARALRTDEDLQPLRGREDFRRLLTDGEGARGR